MYNMREEKEIDLIDLMKSIMKKWYIWMICGIVSALLFAGYRYMDNAAQIAENQAINSADIADSLSESEHSQVNNALFYQEGIKELGDYLENSILMQIAPYSEDVSVSHYVINGEEASIDAIKTSYETFIASGAWAESAIQSLALDVEPEYIQELVTTGINRTDAFPGTKLICHYDVSHDSDRLVVSRTFDLVVAGRTAKEAEQLAETIRNQMESYQETLQSKAGKHTLECVEAHVTKRIDEKLIQKKKTTQSTIIDYTDALTKIKNGFNDAQKQHFASRIGENPDVTQTRSQQVSVNNPMEGVVRYALIGLVFGVFAACALLVIQYLFSGTIKTVEELNDYYHLNVYRNTENVVAYCEKTGVKSVFVTSTVEKQSANIDVINNVVKVLQERSIEVRTGESILTNPAAYEQMSQLEAVLLFEKPSVTKSKDMEVLLKKCQELDCKVLGVHLL